MRKHFWKTFTSAGIALAMAALQLCTASTALAAGVREEIPAVANAPDGCTVTIQDAIYDMTTDDSVTVEILYDSAIPVGGFQMTLLADGNEPSKSGFPIYSIDLDPERCFDYQQRNVNNGMFACDVDESDPPKAFKVFYELSPAANVKPGRYQLTADVQTVQKNKEAIPVTVNAGTLTVKGFPDGCMTAVTIGDAVFDTTMDETVVIPVKFKSLEAIAGVELQLFADGEVLSKNNLPISSIALSPERVFDVVQGNKETGELAAMVDAAEPSDGFTVNYTIKPSKHVKPGIYHLTADVIVRGSDKEELKTLLNTGTLTVKGNPKNGTAKITVSDAAFDPAKSNEVQVTAKVDYDKPLAAAELHLLVNDAPYTDTVFTVKDIQISPKLFKTIAFSAESASLTAMNTTSSEESGTFDVIFTLVLNDGAEAGTYKLSTRSLFTAAPNNTMHLEETPGTLTVPVSGTEPTDPSDEKPGATMYGDLNGDKVVNILDVILLNKNLMVGVPLSDEAKANADVDLNGFINAVDSLNILKAVVKLITLPVE